MTVASRLPKNYLIRTDDFTATYWAGVNASIGGGFYVAPDGTSTAQKLVEDNANATHSIVQNSLLLTNYISTSSVYAKAVERSWLQIWINGSTPDAAQYFDVANGVAGNSVYARWVAGGVIPCPNGWFRCWVAGIFSVSIARSMYWTLRLANGGGAYLGDGVSGLLLWRPQINLGIGPDDTFITTEVPRT